MVTFLSGGTGTPKLLRGAGAVFAREETTVIANTGDDVELGGLFVSPDCDTVIFERSGVLNHETWWGIADDTTVTNERVGELAETIGLDRDPGYRAATAQTEGHPLARHRRFAGVPEFMTIGERDRAHHMVRTRMLRDGATLTATTRALADAYGLTVDLLPMSDDPVASIVHTPDGPFHFQEFWVGRGGSPRVTDVAFRGAESAEPTDPVLDALDDTVVIGPANPVTSLGPMLAMDAFADALAEATVVAVSPFVGETVFSGPAPALMRGTGAEPSTAGVAAALPTVDAFVLDGQDDTALDRPVVRTDTAMDTADDAARVARACADAIAEVA